MIENVVEKNYYELFLDSMYTWMQYCFFYLNVRLHFLNLVATKWTLYHSLGWIKS
jgi:hypothetical protein